MASAVEPSQDSAKVNDTSYCCQQLAISSKWCRGNSPCGGPRTVARMEPPAHENECRYPSAVIVTSPTAPRIDCDMSTPCSHGDKGIAIKSSQVLARRRPSPRLVERNGASAREGE